MFVDVHAHLNFPDYKNDIDEVIRRAQEKNVLIINVGTGRESSRKAVETAHQYPETIWAAAGHHPTEKEIFSREFYEKLAADIKVAAVGECGLDYAVFVRERIKRLQKRASAEVESESEGGLRQEIREIKKQKEIFIKHIELAGELKKPLMIHCRDAFGDLIEVLKLKSGFLSSPPGVIHFFTGNINDAEKLLKMGFYFTFGGLITFNRSLDEVIDFLPIDRILLETDSPFVAPAPYRGKRNEPAYIIETAKKLAELKNLSLEKIGEETTFNAQKLFAL